MSKEALAPQRVVSVVSEPLLTTVEVAKHLNVSESWLRLARTRPPDGSTPPWVKFGRSVRYRPAAIEDWLDQCAVEPNVEELGQIDDEDEDDDDGDDEDGLSTGNSPHEPVEQLCTTLIRT